MAPKSSVVSTPSGQSHARSGRTLLGRLWYRQLDHYPDNGPRAVYLAIVVLVTITLYYQLYVQFSVSTLIIRDFGMTFTFFVYISVVGNAIGAFASLAAGLADRWGRANLVMYGLLVTSVLVLVGLPNAPNKVTYLVLYAAVSLVEGMLLVATPALIRDFSPRLGRRVGDGILDARPGDRRPGGHRGVEQHAGEPSTLADPVRPARSGPAHGIVAARHSDSSMGGQAVPIIESGYPIPRRNQTHRRRARPPTGTP